MATAKSGMRVLVTGGTGFVGMHTVLALHHAGHDVCLYVRNPGKMERVFKPFGLHKLEHVVGDIIDRRTVNRALKNRDAVVHSAAIVNVHAKDARKTITTNKRATELVIGGAVREGIERILQVSSTTALFGANRKTIDENTPLGDAAHGYGRSKVACDRYVRRLQDQGAPIYTTYPGSVIGPDDPGMSEGVLGLQKCLDDILLITSSGIQLIDARDLALAHVTILERGGPPDRYVMGGQYFGWAEFADLLETLLGKSLRRVYAPRLLLLGLGQWIDLVSRFTPIEAPITYEALTYASEWKIADDSKAKRELGIQYRDIRETLTDTILWLHDSGNLRRKELAANLLRARDGEKG
ncbi:MAG: NAD-dependent epimerase/dehydratase family protein [Gammaproteobacteria bacterium]|nr:NAD-dependent epimerase/dehydratase family protein [Gammaproteobacteria bacterium]